MNELTAAVRRLVRLEALRYLCPLSSSVADQYAAAWLAAVRLLPPSASSGRLGAVSDGLAMRRVERLLAAFRSAVPQNDVAHLEGVAEVCS